MVNASKPIGLQHGHQDSGILRSPVEQAETSRDPSPETVCLFIVLKSDDVLLGHLPRAAKPLKRSTPEALAAEALVNY